MTKTLRGHGWKIRYGWERVDRWVRGRGGSLRRVRASGEPPAFWLHGTTRVRGIDVTVIVAHAIAVRAGNHSVEYRTLDEAIEDFPRFFAEAQVAELARAIAAEQKAVDHLRALAVAFAQAVRGSATTARRSPASPRRRCG